MHAFNTSLDKGEKSVSFDIAAGILLLQHCILLTIPLLNKRDPIQSVFFFKFFF